MTKRETEGTNRRNRRRPSVPHWVRWAGGLLAALGVLAVAPPLFVVWLLGREPTGSHEATQANVHARMISVDLARAYRLPVVASVTPTRAGGLLYAVQSAGRSSFNERLREPDPWIREPIFYGPCSAELFVNESRTGLAHAFDRDRLELREDELRCLRELGSHEVWPVVSRLTGADEADVVAAAVRLPVDEELAGVLVPVPSVGSVRSVAYAAVGLSARDAAEGQYESAEHRLREVASVAVVLVDNASSLLDELVGAVVAELATDALEALYRHSGDDQAARSVALARDSLQAVVASTSGHASEPEFTVRRAERRAELVALLRDPDTARGLRWGLVQEAETIRCSRIREYVLGVGGDLREALDVARSHLVRYRSEEAYFAALTNPLHRGAAAELRATWEGVGIPPPPVVDSPILGFGDRILRAPGVGVCFMTLDRINAVQ